MRTLMLIVILAIAVVTVAQDAAVVETQTDETSASAAEAPEQLEDVAEPEATAEPEEAEATDDAEAVKEAPAVDAYAEVADIMQHLCMECHGDYGHDAGFKLPTTREGTGMVGVPSIQRTDLMLIDLEKPESSYLIMKLRDDAGILGKRMPIVRLLDEEQLSMFDLWVGELSAAYLASLEPEEAKADEGGGGGECDDDIDDEADHDGDDDDEMGEHGDQEDNGGEK